MKNITKIISILTLTTLFFSCERPITLDVEQTEPVYIIDGLITNQEANHRITISKSQFFYDSGENPTISNADVQVVDNEGNNWVFTESDPGEYLSETAFSGKVGNSYTMTIKIDGLTFTATDELSYLQPIDTLIAIIDEDEFEDPEVEGEYWDFLTFLTEPQATEDYYLLKFLKNGEVFNYDGQDVYVFNDDTIQENVDGFTSNTYYREGETGGIEFHRISRAVFVFYNSLGENLNNDGGVFSGQPSNVTSNISGGALGVFMTSSVDRREIVME